MEFLTFLGNAILVLFIFLLVIVFVTAVALYVKLSIDLMRG